MEAIFDVKRVSDEIMLIKLVVRKNIVAVLSVYPPQTGLDHSVKDLSYENLQWIQTKISASEILFVCGDFNGHTVINVDGYEGGHGGRGFGRRNLEGERILEIAVTHNLVVFKFTFQEKGDSSGNISNLVKIKVKLITSLSSGIISN